MSTAMLKSLNFLVHRYLLRSDTLEASLPAYGLNLRVKTRDVIGRHIYKYGAHDPQMTRFLQDSLALQPGDVVLDVGANIGWYSLILNKMAPEGVDIYAFEPHPGNRALLEENLRRNAASGVHIVASAVSDHCGEQDLFVYSGANTGRHSLLPINSGERIRIQTTTLDEFWSSRDLGQRTPRFIKVDIEGYELMALRGGQGVLQRCPTVLFEYSPQFMQAAGQAPEELLDLMFGLGFDCSRLDDGKSIPIERSELLQTSQQCNLLWQKKAPA